MVPKVPPSPPSPHSASSSNAKHPSVALPVLRVVPLLALCIALGVTFSARALIPNRLRLASATKSHSLLYSSSSSALTSDLSSLPSSLSSYVAWHAKHRQCYQRPRWHTDTEANSSLLSSTEYQDHCHPLPQTLVWKCPYRNKTCAGLGDRVRGIQVTLLIAVASRRLFFIAMPDDPFPFEHVISPHVINWTLPSSLSASIPDIKPDTSDNDSNKLSSTKALPTSITDQNTNITNINTNSWYHLDWFFCNRARFRVGAVYKRRKCRPGKKLPHDQALPHVSSSSFSLPDIDAYIDDFPFVLSPFTFLSVSCRLPGILVMHLLRNQAFVKHVPDLHERLISTSRLLQLLVRLLFQPAKQVHDIIGATLPSSFVNEGYLAIHARTGQDVGENEDPRFLYFNSHFNDTVVELLHCAMQIDQSSNRKHNRVFLAADSINFKSTFAYLAANLPNVLNDNDNDIAPIDVRFINQRAYHFGIRTDKGRWKNRFANESAQYTAFLNVFADLYMLGSAHTIITTGSGFARTAYWLGRAQRLLIVEPGNGTAHCTA